MNALRRMHRSLVTGGVMLDMQPALADPIVLAGDGELGRMDGSGLQLQAAETDAGLAKVVGTGLFAFEGEVFFDLVHRFDTASELLDEVGSWRLQKLRPKIRAQIGRARAPFEVHERCVLRRLRRL